MSSNLTFGKIYSSITESSIWCESHQVIRVWCYMIAKKDSEGLVVGSPPAIAHNCHMSLEEFLECEKVLTSPDPHSKTPGEEGRRLRKIQGGYVVVNHEQYTGLKDTKRAAYMRDWRAKKVAVGDNGGRKSDGNESRETELPKGFPTTLEEALKSVSMVPGCTNEFAETVWQQAMGRGGVDARNMPIRNWTYYLGACCKWDQQRKRQTSGNGSNTAPGAPRKPFPEVQLKAVDEEILRHPANPQSTFYRQDCTDLDKASLKALRAKRQELIKEIAKA